jgi:protease PrsW
VLGAAHRWLINPDRNMTVLAGSVGLIAIVVGVALLVATTAVYFLGRNRIRASSEGFSSVQEQGG